MSGASNGGIVLHEPPRGPLVCDYCGKFVAAKDAKLEREYGDYGSILSTTVRCPRHK